MVSGFADMCSRENHIEKDDNVLLLMKVHVNKSCVLQKMETLVTTVLLLWMLLLSPRTCSILFVVILFLH